MAATACLRVLVDADRTALPEETLGRLVSKFARAFLEARWSWPRQADPLTHYCYLLTDPRAEDLDTVELARLSHELQERLFGTGEEAAIQLLLFEGSPEAIETFAGYSADHVVRAMDDPGGLPAGGVLKRITPDGLLVDIPESAGPETPKAQPPALERVQGIYFPARELFVGDVVSCTPAGAPTHYSLIDGQDHFPEDPARFDAACLTSAMRFLIEHDMTTPLYVPVCFSTLMRASARAAYLALLGVVPESTRPNLAASVYDVPRSPSFQAINMLHQSLDRHFARIDLRTADPAFEVDQLGHGDVTSVTLVLAPGSPEDRLAVLRRFAARAGGYRRRRIWSAVTNICTRAERELAVGLGVPFITGPGVCRLQTTPLGGRPWPVNELPVLSEMSPFPSEALASVHDSAVGPRGPGGRLISRSTRR